MKPLFLPLRNSPPKKPSTVEHLLGRNLLKNGETYDKPLVWVLLCLLCFGLVMVYSASAIQAGQQQFGNRAFFLIKQLQFAGIGLAIRCCWHECRFGVGSVGRAICWG